MSEGTDFYSTKIFLVTGGSGFFGCWIVKDLLRRGAKKIHILDFTKKDFQDDRVEYFLGDIRDTTVLQKACGGVDTVFHVASLVRFDILSSPLVHDVNINGTSLLIDECKRSGIKHFVYTSTCNVVHSGVVHLFGDETLPYPKQYIDCYSESKCAAEKLVLNAGKNGDLLTCVIRPSGIYSDEGAPFFSRVMNTLKTGLPFPVVAPEAIADFSHVNNLVLGHLLACENLHTTKSANSQAYFINDGEPMNTYKFFQPIIEALGFKFSSFVAPTFIFWYFAYFLEIIHFLVGRRIRFTPYLTRLEVSKIVYDQYYSNEKAMKDLGYQPLFNTTTGTSRVLEHLSKNPKNHNFKLQVFHRNLIKWWLLIPSAMILLTTLAFHDEYFVGDWPCSVLHFTTFGLVTKQNYLVSLKLICVTAWLTHVFEVWVGFQKLKNTHITLINTFLWLFQIFCLGYPSLAQLNKTTPYVKRGETSRPTTPKSLHVEEKRR